MGTAVVMETGIALETEVAIETGVAPTVCIYLNMNFLEEPGMFVKDTNFTSVPK